MITVMGYEMQGQDHAGASLTRPTAGGAALSNPGVRDWELGMTR
jgi:hypothetical protein